MRHTFLPVAVIVATVFSVCIASDTDSYTDKPGDQRVTAVVTKVTETRMVDLASKPEDDSHQFSFSNDQPALTLTLEMMGPAAVAATHYGMINITKAVDDQGNNLTLQSMDSYEGDPTTEFLVIDRDDMFFGEQDKPTDKLRFKLKFEPSQRGAGKIAALEGSISLRSGVVVPVQITAPNTRIGQTIDHPALKSAGMTVKIVEPGGFGGDDKESSVGFELNDPKSALVDVDIVDGQGESISNFRSTMSFGNKTTYTVGSDGPLPGDAKLVITVLMNARDTAVPLKMENIPLP